MERRILTLQVCTCPPLRNVYLSPRVILCIALCKPRRVSFICQKLELAEPCLQQSQECGELRRLMNKCALASDIASHKKLTLQHLLSFMRRSAGNGKRLCCTYGPCSQTKGEKDMTVLIRTVPRKAVCL